MDRSAVGWEHRETVAKHESQTGRSGDQGWGRVSLDFSGIQGWNKTVLAVFYVCTEFLMIITADDELH